MKKIVFVSTGMSGSHPCTSRAASLTFALSQSYPSLLLSRSASSDGIPVSLLMAEPANWREDLGARLDRRTEGGAILLRWHVVVIVDVGLDFMWHVRM